MEEISNFFNKRLGIYVGLLVLSVSLYFSQISSKIIAVIIGLVSFFGAVYEFKIMYYIKFYKRTKEFKSSNEAFIANYFGKKKIRYIYERRIKLGKDVLHPDFYLPEFDVCVEYWGMWNSDFEYRKECNHKRQIYRKYGQKLVELYPDNVNSFNQLDWKFTERLLNVLKEDRAYK